ncbi:MAG: SulP family inorganic anion transporter [Microbacterium sp.]
MSARTRRFADLLPSAADYRAVPRTWRRDLVAGVTVGIVALPLALGFGVSSGAGAEAGLVTAIVAGVIAAVFGGSHVQVSGPTGAMVVVLGPIVAQHGIGAVATVSIMAGIIVLAAGAARLGRAVSFIPWPVIEGFTLGIAVIIGLQQVPSLVAAAAGQHDTNAAVAAVQSIASADVSYLPWALGAAVIVVACMIVCPLIHPAIPGSLVGIAVVAIAATVVPNPLMPIGALPSTLPPPSLPAVDPPMLLELVGPAATVAALAAIESLLSARVASSLADTGAISPDRELVGQGLASIGAGVFGGMPATGAIARTAVSVRAGGRTRLTAVTHALLLLAVVFVASAPVSAIPIAALGGVLVMTAVRMVRLSTVRVILRSTRSDAAAFVLTAIVTVSFDLIVAVAIGVVFAGFFAIRNLAGATRVTPEPLPGEAVDGDERIAVLRFDGPLIFSVADRVLDDAQSLDGVQVAILRMSRLEFVDATGANVLSTLVRALERRGITVLIKGVQPMHEGLFRRVGVLASLRHHRHLFADLDDAVAHARDHIRRAEP